MAFTSRATQMTQDEVVKVADGAARRQLGAYGFERIEVRTDRDFDDDPVWRVIAHVGDEVPAKAIIDTLAEIRTTLIGQGEEQLVFFDTRRPGTDLPDDDEED